MVSQWVDVHAHFYPPETPARRRERLELMHAACWATESPPEWDPQSTLGYMDRAGIAMQLLSNVPKSLDEFRASNAYGASLARHHPARFGFLAALPTDDPDAALAEIARSDELGADGFAVTCCYNGVFLSDRRLWPVWAELDRRRATVFMHPDAYAPGSFGRPCVIVEVAFETGRTVVDMLYTGLFRDFPNVTFVVAHCGGTVPALSGRLLLLGNERWVPNPQRITRDEMRDGLRRLYLDTAATCPTTLAPALMMTTYDHLVYGSDCGVPCTTDETMAANIAALEAYPGLTPDQVDEIGRNALRVFPRAARRLLSTAGR